MTPAARRLQDATAIDHRRGSAHLLGSGASGDDGSRPRVLVIDDDDALCGALRQVLGDAGYAVATVPHGAAALELVRAHEPAVILLDLRMPIMDGWSFVEQYRRLAHPGAAIVLMSGARDLGTIATTLAADGHIAKPFDLAEVTRTVAAVVRKG